jgi:hypothetical protein
VVSLVRRAALTEGLHAFTGKPILHGDNGATRKATTVFVMLNWLGIASSHSRPRVSNNNPYAGHCSAPLNTAPEFPERGFSDLDAARDWAGRLVHWYNHEHRHSAIRYITPAERYAGADHALLRAPHDLYQRAQRQPPALKPVDAELEANRRGDAPSRARATIVAASPANPLSGSAGVPAFPSRPDTQQCRGAQRRGKEERSHPEPRAAPASARAWRAPDLLRSEHRGTITVSRRIRPPAP